MQKVLQGEFLRVPNLFFNDNVYLKFGGVYLYRAENEKLFCVIDLIVYAKFMTLSPEEYYLIPGNGAKN